MYAVLVGMACTYLHHVHIYAVLMLYAVLYVCRAYALCLAYVCRAYMLYALLT